MTSATIRLLDDESLTFHQWSPFAAAVPPDRTAVDAAYFCANATEALIMWIAREQLTRRAPMPKVFIDINHKTEYCACIDALPEAKYGNIKIHPIYVPKDTLVSVRASVTIYLYGVARRHVS